MERIYTIIFFVGVIYTLVTFLFGGLLGIIDAGLDAHIDTSLDGSDPFILPLKPITIVSFITVLGGVGIIGTHYKFNWIAILVISIILGLIVSVLLYRFIVVPLYRAQNTSAVYQEKLIGMTAVVISPILENGFGTIAYVVNGSKYNAPAQHVGKEEIKQGQEVLIYEIKNNVFYVEPLNDDYKQSSK
ncbi:NfeD family protein [Clostridium pasteurianum]|uniref:NfeD family protein n=1 Tax=Clostridium pasteurianum TaxID=1501 RepID=UPI002261003E|nr:NfeD family protein [Clostridium pasteurianum]UZW15450.1 NfeD family protein [Clostridium pasteurianum]